MKLLITYGDENKLFHLKEFAEALSKLGVEYKLVKDTDYVVGFPSKKIKMPHMGWNRLRTTTTHPLLAGLDDISHVYFVHSYYVPVNDATIATCNYGLDFTAIAARDNFLGCQFHPERSGQVGARILQNFLEMPR